MGLYAKLHVIQGHQTLRFFSHRQSPWRAALSWRNSHGGRCVQFKIHSPWFNLPFPTHDWKTSFVLFFFLIENLCRERRLTQKAAQSVFFQPTVPLQKREGTIVSGGTCYTTLLSHKFMKSSSIKTWANQEKNHRSPSMPRGKEI